MIKTADEFQAALHRLPGQHGFIARTEMRREMCRGEIIVSLAKHFIQLMHVVVQQEGAVHPEVAAFGILDPCLHVRQYVEKIAQGFDGGCGGGFGFHKEGANQNVF